MDESLEKIKQFFAADRFAMENGIEIMAAEPGYAYCRCPICRIILMRAMLSKVA